MPSSTSTLPACAKGAMHSSTRPPSSASKITYVVCWPSIPALALDRAAVVGGVLLGQMAEEHVSHLEVFRGVRLRLVLSTTAVDSRRRFTTARSEIRPQKGRICRRRARVMGSTTSRPVLSRNQGSPVRVRASGWLRTVSRYARDPEIAGIKAVWKPERRADSRRRDRHASSAQRWL
jgi:hypothetical protein